MDAYRDRLEMAIVGLQLLHDNVKPYGGRDGDMNAHFEKERLAAKIEGVKLALSYFDEMER